MAPEPVPTDHTTWRGVNSERLPSERSQLSAVLLQGNLCEGRQAPRGGEGGAVVTEWRKRTGLFLVEIAATVQGIVGTSAPNLALPRRGRAEAERRAPGGLDALLTPRVVIRFLSHSWASVRGWHTKALVGWRWAWVGVFHWVDQVPRRGI